MSAFFFYPFDMGPSEGWVLIYFLMAGMVLFVTWVIREHVAKRADIRQRLDAENQPDLVPQGYRSAPAQPVHQRLTPGYLPQPDELWAVAYLRGGARAVTETLLCSALAAGWLIPSANPAAYHHLGGSRPGDALAAAFFDALTGMRAPTLTRAQVHATAASIASQAESDIKAELAISGFVRSRHVVTTLRMIVAIGCGIALLLGAFRMLVRQEMSHGAAPVPVILLFGMAIVAGVAFWMATGLKTSTNATTYLAWLADATTSLRADVAGARRTAPLEVVLSVAVAGACALQAIPACAAVGWEFHPMRDDSSTTAGGGGCSSSSCGGGGGSGCGGGGGCS